VSGLILDNDSRSHLTLQTTEFIQVMYSLFTILIVSCHINWMFLFFYFNFGLFDKGQCTKHFCKCARVIAKGLFFICSPVRQMSQNKPKNIRLHIYTRFIQY